jgi:hypothetical protein
VIKPAQSDELLGLLSLADVHTKAARSRWQRWTTGIAPWSQGPQGPALAPTVLRRVQRLLSEQYILRGETRALGDMLAGLVRPVASQA